MNLKSVLALFGHNAAYVVVILLVVVVILIVTAFWQGRAVDFWPPRIAAQQPREQPEHADELGGSVFEVDDAKNFYQSIAPNYDQRNSVNLLATHLETIIRIQKLQKLRADNPALRVLDLGGGTGQNIATHFFNDEKIRWTYVDSCPGMVEQFHQHLAGRPLHKNLTVHMEDINRVHLLGLQPKSYDAMLLSLVLSSMPRLPDFTKIAELLAPGGLLIVSDIDPLYTQAQPYYRATAADGTTVSMRMNPVQLLEVIGQAKAAGLRLSDVDLIGKADIRYSFIATFASASPEVVPSSVVLRRGVATTDDAAPAAEGMSQTPGTGRRPAWQKRRRGASGTTPARADAQAVGGGRADAGFRRGATLPPRQGSGRGGIRVQQGGRPSKPKSGSGLVSAAVSR